MAGNNHAPGTGFYTAITDHEIERRIALVRTAKANLGRAITDDELDALIPPTPCRRTRLRLTRTKSREARPTTDH